MWSKVEKLEKSTQCGWWLKNYTIYEGERIFFSLSDVMLGIISDSMTHANLIVAIWLENELFITSNICKAFSVLFFIHFDDEKPHYKTMDMSFATHTSRKNHMNFTSARSHPCGSFSCAFKLALVWCGFHAIIFKLFLPLGDRLISAEQRQGGLQEVSELEKCHVGHSMPGWEKKKKLHKLKTVEKIVSI